MHIIPYLGYLLRIITLLVTIQGVLQLVGINSFPIVILQKTRRRKNIFDQHILDAVCVVQRERRAIIV